jgi:hypothetical protein
LVTLRSGASSLGCLFTLLVIAAAVYVGLGVGGKYWRYYQFEDDVRQEVRFAAHTQNDTILNHLRASADSLGLPDDARDITIRRNAKMISIDCEYDDRVELPGYSRAIHFHPHAEGPLE